MKTNNPTIDGVSRAMIERIADRLSKAQMFKESTELRARLDAPAAERQEPVHEHDCCANCMRPRIEHCGENCPAPDTSVWHAWDYNFAPGAEATLKVSALQSTIAQLQARIAELESGSDNLSRRGPSVALYTATGAGGAIVPNGWKLVPIEATRPMLRAFIAGGCSRSSYRDMIAAAPICLDATAALNGAGKK